MKIIKEKSKEAIKEAIKSIKNEEILVLATDTIYGLVADATSKKAVAKIFKIKNRQKSKPLPIFIRDINMAKNIAKIDKNRQEFLKEVWPGKITVVFKIKKGCNLSKNIFGNKKTIGLRWPDYKFINVLISQIKRPLIGTSANISGEGNISEIKKIINQFKNRKYRPDLIIDAGNLKKCKASTVVDFTKEAPEILRIGEISEDKILKIIKE
jgi:L-threonylcarbamoyladenylate synthase